MNKEKVIDKIKKLLQLSQSNNPNEAALALQNARKMMDKYGVTISELSVSDIKEKGVKAGNWKTAPDYISVIAETVKDLFQCEFYWVTGLAPSMRSYQTKAVFIGFQPNEEIASYCFEVLVRQIKQDRKKHRERLRGLSGRRLTKHLDAYCVGWAIAIYRKVKAMVPPPPEMQVPSETGLVPVNPLEEYLKKKNITESMGNRSSDTSLASTAYGYEDGQKVDINKGMNNRDTLKLN